MVRGPRSGRQQSYWVTWAAGRKAEAERLEKVYIRQADNMAKAIADYGCSSCDPLIEFRMDGDAPVFKNPTVTHQLTCPQN